MKLKKPPFQAESSLLLLQSRVSQLETSNAVLRRTVRLLQQGKHPADSLTEVDTTAQKRIEPAPRDCYAMLRSVIDKTTNLIAVKDKRGRVLLANRALLRFLGKTEAEVLGGSDLKFVRNAAQAAQVAKNDRRIMKTGRPQTIEESVEMAASLRTVRFTKSPYRDANGRVIGIMGIGVDITTEKQAKQALQAAHEELEHKVKERTAELSRANELLRAERERLRKSESLYRTTVDAMDEPLHVATPDLRIEVFNSAFRRWCKRLGLKVDAIGQKPRELFHFLPPKVMKEYRQVLSSGEQLITQDTLLIKGKTVVTETRKIPVMHGGEPVRVITVINDITERKRIDEALRDSEAKYRQLFAVEPDALVLVDGKTLRFIDVNDNACRLYGYTREEFIRLKQGRTSTEPEASRQSLKNVLNKGKQFVPLRYHIKKDGTVFPVEISFRVISLSGRPTVFAAVRDITERVQAEEGLRATRAKLLVVREEERKHIARELHDSVSQGLFAATMNLRGVQESASTSTGGKALKQRLGGLAKHLTMVLADVQGICRGLYPPSLELLGLPPSLRGLVDAYGSNKTKVAIRCSAAVEMERFGEQVEICFFRIAQEALANAMRHGKPKQIALTLDYENSRLRIRVIDDGRGFDLDEGCGKGLGLASMRERIEALGGHFEITSRPARTCVEAVVEVVKDRRTRR